MTKGLEEAAAQVPAEREAKLGEIKRKSEGCGKCHSFARIGGSRTGIIKIPGMAGAHTSTVSSRRDVHFEERGNAKEEIVVERDTELCPDIHVAHTRGPHLVAHLGALVRVGMVVVNRKATTRHRPH